MPVKLSPRLASENEARIEIIPLIDIMFFLLAAFMLVSLSMVKMQSVKVDLPTATVATPETKREFLNISVDKSGMAFLDEKPIGHHELVLMLAGMRKTNETIRVFISGDKNAKHGDVIQVLDAVRSAGVEKVAFEIREPAGTGR